MDAWQFLFIFGYIFLSVFKFILTSILLLCIQVIYSKISKLYPKKIKSKHLKSSSLQGELSPNSLKELCPHQHKLLAKKKTNNTCIKHKTISTPQPHTHRTQEEINSSKQLNHQLLFSLCIL